MQKSTILHINFASLITTILVNYLLNSRIINGNTVKTVSDRYENMFTPADYAFGIWGIIYLLLTTHFIYCFFLLKKNSGEAQIINKVGLLFAVTSLINCLWIYFWLNDFIGICLLLMIALLYVLTTMLTRITPKKEPTTLTQLITTTPFTLYGGWVCVAMIANAAEFLVKLGWKHTLEDELWTILLIIIAGFINILLSWRYRAVAFGLAGAWGLSAVALNNLDNNYTVSVVGILTATAILSTCFYIGTRKLTSKQSALETS